MENIVSILEFGANSGVSELNTSQIQAAIDHCFLSGGGTVQIPEGIFHTGGIRLRSNVTLHMMQNAVLKGSKNPEDYFGYMHDTVEPLDKHSITNAEFKRAEFSDNMDEDYKFIRIPGSRWNNAIIRGINAENISIIGEEGSRIDGCDCYDEQGEENYRGPHAINLFNCKNITLKGYCVQNSANWANSAFYCDNISVENIKVLAGHDGIHLTSCNNIKINSCEFYSGDDCVAGFDNVNVSVSDCVLNSACSAMRFGGTNVLVERCHMYGPCKYLFRGSLSTEEKKKGIMPSTKGHRNNMLSVFTYYSDFSFPIRHQPGNIIIKDCKIDFADRFLHYNYSGNEPFQQNRPLQSIKFENIDATNISMPLTVYGDRDIKVSLEMKNINITMRKGYENIDFIHACNFENIKLKNISISNFKGVCIVKKWSDGSIEFINNNFNGINNMIEDAKEDFFAIPI